MIKPRFLPRRIKGESDMAGYTAIAEAGQAIVALLRREMTPEPVSKPELIGLGSPFEPDRKSVV